MFLGRKFETRNPILAAGMLIFLLMVLWGYCGRVYAAEGVEDESTIDFVLVLDNSGTMAKSDPDGLTVSAAKMFIDMLPNKNARVAVVEFGSDYGEAAFAADKYTNYVSVPFPLSDITSIDQKEACKKVIDDATQDGSYTPVGYAFQAACDVLQQGGAVPGNAGILLISDFRVTGQKKEDFLDGGYNFQSLVDAEAIAAENEWPVYTLELNFDGKNDNPSDYRERIAERLRNDIPEKVGYGDYIPLTDAEDAQARFAEIFQLFFAPDDEDESHVQTQITDENGDAEFQFSVGPMVAELNVTLTCEDSSLIRGIEIGRGDSMSAYDLTDYSEPIQEENRTITREDRHIMIKMMVPEPDDDWKVVVHGEADTEIGMYALSVHDMNLQLTAEPEEPEESEESEESERLQESGKTEDSKDPEASITSRQKGTVQFKASYLYKGIPYNSSQVYAAYPAVLEIMETGEQIPMTAGESEYTVSVPFADSGCSFTVYAISTPSGQMKYCEQSASKLSPGLSVLLSSAIFSSLTWINCSSTITVYSPVSILPVRRELSLTIALTVYVPGSANG
ncbi:MAG: VWA domain-containing protein, partial [Butyrivibrio sp.]|nr:VWA domain-containing protein [Butyrivibrio sp.]